jgi:hypothetical protein
MEPPPLVSRSCRCRRPIRSGLAASMSDQLGFDVVVDNDAVPGMD